ncbi:MAG: hypothetical protein ABR958_00270 [Dehalococcoidales bacterium]
MNKPKNLLLDGFNSEVFELKPQKILFIYDKEKSYEKYSGFIDKMKEKFPGWTFTLYDTSTIKNNKLKEKYALVIPVEPYDIDGTVRPALERLALRTDMRFYLIYEDTYGYIRLAGKWDLFYRLYIKKIIVYLYLLFGFIFIIVPCHIFYIVTVLINYLQGFFLKGKMGSQR